jgi:hypothetical protein
MITHPTLDPDTAHYAMSEKTYIDFCNIISMLDGFSSIVCELDPSTNMEVKNVSGIISTARDSLERIREELSYTNQA